MRTKILSDHGPETYSNNSFHAKIIKAKHVDLNFFQELFFPFDEFRKIVIRNTDWIQERKRTGGAL